MRIAKVEIANLWGKELIEIPFKHRVSFLTGSNGSGKSTILNIIHDVLNQQVVNDYHLVTTKNTNWAASIFYNDNFCKSLVNLCVSDEKGFMDFFEKEIINNHKNLPINAAELWGLISSYYSKCDKDKDNSYQAKQTYVFNANSSLVKNKTNCLGFCGFAFEKNKAEDEVKLNENQPLNDERQNNTAFIFQEDRIYDRKNLKSKLSDLSDWNDFYISMDSRYESLVDDVRSFELKYSRRGTQQNDAEQKLSEFDDVISKLNSYFEVEGKSIYWDDEQKITLKRNSDSEYTPWYMLSRGEKTIIYLFLSVFLYKDKVSVFLLDEPEISLHVRWQHTLIKDLSEIAPRSSFIVATHSPSLVQKGWHSHCLDISKL
ncbi:hypothetical protein BBM40_16195 [Vibrio parahaemolyticus]|uniref:AAA family ATPase n=1 Tax=Vibrio parahaemolyticus TaxID=670 RepID=UPI00084BBF8B|nr:ATP-binding protein [Vibrio parahaemolyticus]ODZ47880.1 hypothetical protein BBM40_16195 [Vibrio parahaemolyticus]